MLKHLCGVLFTLAASIALAASNIPLKKHYVDVSGGQLHYVAAGEGPTVLLLHQAPLSHAEFLKIIPRLAETFRVVAWDAPGHGNSYIPPREYEVPDYLNALDEFVTALDLAPVNIVGNHSGAAFAREYAAVYPSKTRKVILSGSARQPPEPKMELTNAKEFLSQPYSRELTLSRSGDFLAPAWQRYVTLASPTASLDDVLIPFIIGLDARTKPYDLHLAIFRYKGWADPGQVATPILLLSGQDDFFVNQEGMDYTCTLYPNCEVHPMLPGAAAFIGLARPRAYAEAIIGFFER
jgi:pimeloyl-ACP methyl ester carboxylesterase